MTYEQRALVSGDQTRRDAAVDSSDSALALRAMPMDLPFVAELFDHVPGVTFSAKDSGLRFTAANAAMLTLCGVDSSEEILGRRSSDFFSPASRRRYETIDQMVIRTGRPVCDQIDLIVRRTGKPLWAAMSRYPVFDNDKKAVGVVCVSRQLVAPDHAAPASARVEEAVDYIDKNYSGQISLLKLASRGGASLSQLDRDFVQILGLTPRQYLVTVRIRAALELLAEEDMSIADIAMACGYSDQSAFTRRFHKVTGMTPRRYREMLCG